MDDNEYTKVLLLTANVGSIFEEPDKMLPIWLKEFLSAISKLQPEFVAIHCQEVGGKNYEETMQHVNKFIKMLLASEEMVQFDRARVFLDEDFTAVEKFTALGSLYFVHRCVRTVEIFDFYDKKFVPVEGKEVLSGNIEHVHIKEKSKFPQDFFPDFVWSRKGFIRTRWNLNNTLFDLVNIHLFHDISNLAAMEKSPSTYSSHRERALMHTVERFETDEYDKVPYFVFGDFNFRMDTNRLVKELTMKTTEEKIKGKKNDVSAVLFKKEDDDRVILKVGKKDFYHYNHNDVFSCDKAMSLMIYDSEPSSCHNKLFEYPVTFPPSYPFSENVEEGTSYMPTRCPGWCDRIMMSHSALPLLFNVDGETPDYVMIGRNTCMGDHKPIMLNLKILNNCTPGTNDTTCSSPVVSGHVSVVVGHDNDFQINGTTTTNLSRHLVADDDGNKNVISINGRVVVASNLNDINIHKNIKFELDELVTTRFKQVLMREQGNQGEQVKGLSLSVQPSSSSSSSSPSAAPLAPTTTTKIKPSLSFRNVVNNVLKSDSILRYMKRFKHRSDSESDDDDEDDDHQQQQQQQQQPQVSKSTEVLANSSAACASPASNAVEADDDDDACENANNSNNNIANSSDVDLNVVDASVTNSSTKRKNNKKKKRCTIQ